MIQSIALSVLLSVIAGLPAVGGPLRVAPAHMTCASDMGASRRFHLPGQKAKAHIHAANDALQEGTAPPKRGSVLALHLSNPRYFIWRGKPTLLVGSGEHYGAVLNRRFDYVKYLDTLKLSGLNHTRLFTGLYVEDNGQGAQQKGNTLDPAPGELLCPFARSDTPGYPKGGNKFDLRRWNAAFFSRLQDFVAKASDRGVVVEVSLFCPYYDDRFNQWKLSPLNSANNINGVGRCQRSDVFTLDRSDSLLSIEEEMVRRIVVALNRFDNVYYEICNEPYGQGVTSPWEKHITDVVTATETELPVRHLVSQNVDSGATGKLPIEGLDPRVSLFNFHYAGPDVVAMNQKLNRAIGVNETGFKGTEDAPYRREAWEFVLAGGALFSHLDYSFAVGHEDGTFVNPGGQWGGGSPALRKQLRYLAEFMNSMDFVRMAPDNKLVRSVPEGMTARALAETEKAYAVYLGPNGQFSVRWTGFVTPRFAGTYTFSTETEGSVRLWINGRKVIDNSASRAQVEDTCQVTLAAGQTVAITMEYAFVRGYATAKLYWSSNRQEKQVVPNECLSTPDGKGAGLKGEYFQGTGFRRPRLTRTDAVLGFYWSVNLPWPEGSAPCSLDLDLPAGRYRAEWMDTLTGKVDKTEEFQHQSGSRTLVSPATGAETALRLRRN